MPLEPARVFHVAITTETEADPAHSVLNFCEATFTTRSDADRVATAVREIFAESYKRAGHAQNAYRTRVGVLELPAPDPRIGNRRPLFTTAEIPAFIERTRRENLK